MKRNWFFDCHSDYLLLPVVKNHRFLGKFAISGVFREQYAAIAVSDFHQITLQFSQTQ